MSPSVPKNKYVRLRNTRTEVYAGRVACLLPVSHVARGVVVTVFMYDNITNLHNATVW